MNKLIAEISKDRQTLHATVWCFITLLKYALEDDNYPMCERISKELEKIEDVYLEKEKYIISGIAFEQCSWCNSIHCTTDDDKEHHWIKMRDVNFHDIKHVGEITHTICPDCEEEMEE